MPPKKDERMDSGCVWDAMDESNVEFLCMCSYSYVYVFRFLSLNVGMNWNGMKVKEASASPSKKNIVPFSYVLSLSQPFLSTLLSVDLNDACFFQRVCVIYLPFRPHIYH
jgi:hypothetical protein